LQEAFERIERFPEIGANAEFGWTTRRWKLARFPYSIIYLGTEHVRVIAIAHDRRRPGYWRGRSR
jgi:toxin ParE1/3/4